MNYSLSPENHFSTVLAGATLNNEEQEPHSPTRYFNSTHVHNK